MTNDLIDRIDRIVNDLVTLPEAWRKAEREANELSLLLSDARKQEQDAETDAIINAVIDGKNDAERKRQQLAVVAQSPAVRAASARARELQGKLSRAEIDAKALARRWQSAVALAELQAAKLNYLSSHKTKETTK